jgi:hypothetical protein
MSYPLMRRSTAAWVAVVLNASIFALAHGIPIMLPTFFVMGVMFTLVRERTNSLLPGMLIHALQNALAVLSIYAASHGTTHDDSPGCSGLPPMYIHQTLEYSCVPGKNAAHSLCDMLVWAANRARMRDYLPSRKSRLGMRTLVLAPLAPARALLALPGRMIAPPRLLAARLFRADPQPITAAGGHVGGGRIADAADPCQIIVLGR